MTTDKNLQENISRDFRGLWIPREIWLHPDLSLIDKTLWAELYSLYDREKKGCYASNEYLAKFFGFSDRYIRKSLENLKKHGLVVEVSFNGRQRVLRALTPNQDDGLNDCAKQHGTIVPPSMEPEFHSRWNPSSTIEQSIYQRRKREDNAPPIGGANAPSSFQKNQKEEEKKERAKDVFVSDKEHELLIEKFGEALVLEGYEDFSEWKHSASSAQVKKHKSDYRRLRKWVIPQLLKENKENGFYFTKPPTILNKNMDKKIADHIRDRFRAWYKKEEQKIREQGAQLFEYYDYVSIDGKSIYFNDPNFTKLLGESLEPYRKKK